MATSSPAPLDCRSPLQGRLALACSFLFGLLWLATLGGRSLLSPDEGRYASLSLGMLQSGDWITPRLNGLLYFEKPPLQYWGGAIAMRLFGINEFAARLWPGLAGLATVFLVAFTARRLWGARAGLHGALIAGSCSWIVLNSHFLSLDAGLTAALTLTLCALLVAEAPATTARRGWMLCAWVGIGLAVLSKGLVGVLIPGAVLVLQSAWRLDFAVWRRLQWLPGLALLSAVTLPWFVMVSSRNPDFASFFFVHEHFQRYLSTVHRREGSWWYFVPYLLGGLLPWTSALPWLLQPRRADFAQSLLFTWAAFVFVFFSLSGSKLPSYILPMFPALALLLARAIGEVGPRALRRHLLVPALVWIAALAALTQLGRAGGDATPPAAMHALAVGIGIGAAVALAGLAGAWWLLMRSRITSALALTAATHLVATLIAVQSHDAYGQLKSSDAIARVLAPLTDAATPIYAVRDYDQTLPFYLRRPVTLVEMVDEFEFGENHEPERWVPTLDGFVARWQREPRAAAYMSRATLAALQARRMNLRVVFEDPRRVVVVKP